MRVTTLGATPNRFPLPAGSYGGPLGRMPRLPRPTGISGAKLRYMAAQRQLSGIGGLGNLCNDPGWQFAQALVGGAGSVVGAASGEGTNVGNVTGASLSTIANSWAATCTQQGQTPQGASQSDIEKLIAASQASNQQAISQDRLRNEQMMQQLFAQQAQLAAQQQAAQQNQGFKLDTNTLLIGGGVLLALGVGAVVLLR